ncbi:MAG: hypothetical protein IT441_06435 [Phycisphaeraceae bacterium]|nr:hypothetical protein [Phycisphaeraceae bacterium]
MTGGNDQQTYQRGLAASLLGLGVQLGLLITSALMGLWSQSPAVHVLTWLLLGGLPVWVILLLIYQQHRLERAEALELEQLAAGKGDSAAIFQEADDELGLARRRLDRLYSWGLSGVSVVVGVYLTGIGLWQLSAAYQSLVDKATTAAQTGAGIDKPIGEILTGANLSAIAMGPASNAVGLGVFGAAGAFLAFIAARYLAGMTKVDSWRLLRGGAATLMGAAVGMALVMAGAIAGYFGYFWALGLVALVLPGLMALLGVETLLQQLFGIYRPRRPGERPRPAFESRLLGWLSSPESLAKIINETINYQFGFEVSRSWFYQLMGRAITPLLLVGLAVLVGSSSLVFVGSYEGAIVTRFGRMTGEPLGPGLHVKLPWPIERAKKYDVTRVQEVIIGGEAVHGANMAVLWTNQHTAEEETYMIAAPTPVALELAGRPAAGSPAGEVAAAATGGQRTPGMTLVASQIQVQYRIKDLKQYVTLADDPGRLLGALAQRRVSELFVTRDIDLLLTTDRLATAEMLGKQIQADVDEAGLGLEIIFVGVNSVHPPQTAGVADSFHEQVKALQEKQSAIEKARGTATATLAQVAGSVDKALELDGAIRELEKLIQDAPTGKAGKEQTEEMRRRTAEAQVRVDQLLTAARGQAAETIYDALAYRWERELTERGKAWRFTAQLDAFGRAKHYYMAREYLDVLAEVLPKTRRYVLPPGAAAISGGQVPGVIRLDLKESTTSLSNILQPQQ